MTLSSLFKVMVFGDVTLCSVVVTDVSVLEKHVVEFDIKNGGSTLEAASAPLHDDVPKDRRCGTYLH
jgi:precorrin-4 methylase